MEILKRRKLAEAQKQFVQKNPEPLSCSQGTLVVIGGKGKQGRGNP
jgi:hypothetical protein